MKFTVSVEISDDELARLLGHAPSIEELNRASPAATDDAFPPLPPLVEVPCPKCGESRFGCLTCGEDRP